MTFQKGQSGNPTGRPKKARSLAEIIRERIDPERFAQALLELAYMGDMKAARLVLLYHDGPPAAPGETGDHSQGLLTAQLEAQIIRIYGLAAPVAQIDVTNETTGEDDI